MKLKTILIIIGAVVLIGLIGAVQILSNRNKKLKAEKTRLENNQSALLDREKHYTLLNLMYKEAIKSSALKMDSLSKLLKIKPKTIERIVYKTIIQVDSVPYPVEVEKQGLNFWKISDVTKCYTWQGTARLYKDSLTVSKTMFNYKNDITDVFWKSRRFWIFSKWKYYQESVQTCGESWTKEVVIKKK